MPPTIAQYTISVDRVLERLNRIKLAKGYSFDAQVIPCRWGDADVQYDPGNVIVWIEPIRPIGERMLMAQQIEVRRLVVIRAVPTVDEQTPEPWYRVEDRIVGDLFRALDLSNQADRIAEKATWSDEDIDIPIEGASVTIAIELRHTVRVNDHLSGPTI